jgi:hypothetical protein
MGPHVRHYATPAREKPFYQAADICGLYALCKIRPGDRNEKIL